MTKTNMAAAHLPNQYGRRAPAKMAAEHAQILFFLYANELL
jgi:hypothetical protein